MKKTKKCPKCGEISDNFYHKKDGSYQPYCIECMKKDRIERHRKNNKVAKFNALNKELLLKGYRFCNVCEKKQELSNFRKCGTVYLRTCKKCKKKEFLKKLEMYRTLSSD